MYYFCTYFDHRYLPQSLALYWSLERQCGDFELWSLCMDDEAAEALEKLGLPRLRRLTLQELENAYPRLSETKMTRSLIEYYFTCTPFLLRYLLDRQPEIDLLTYLDADLYFFGNPAPIFEELGDRSIGIFAHRFPQELSDFEKHGIYNVGWVSFRRNQDAISCIRWWGERCLEWCYDRVEDGRFGDQKYLDEWPSRFSAVAVLGEPGAGLGPWNISRSELLQRNGNLTVDGRNAIFYHFHGLKRRGPFLVELGFRPFGVKPSREIVAFFYRPYLRALRSGNAALRSLGIDSQGEKLGRYLSDQEPVSLSRMIREREILVSPIWGFRSSLS